MLDKFHGVVDIDGQDLSMLREIVGSNNSLFCSSLCSNGSGFHVQFLSLLGIFPHPTS